jgi:NAD(P)-dependent dehydrogenase (short-subunit alcohol dehydrogenase family)
MFDSRLMAGQRILVTGGGTGLGQAMAEQFLRLGADVAICGRRKSVCDDTAAAWRTTFPRAPHRHVRRRHPQRPGGRGDGRGAVAVGRAHGARQQRRRQFRRADESLSPRAFDAIANIVFHGTFYVTQAIGKRWVAAARSGAWTPAQPYRSVMSIIVTWVDNGSPYVVPSAMSKAGIEAMTKSLAIEWAKYGVRLNAVGPGEIPTEGMSKRLNPGEEPGARSRKTNPMARAGRMSELQNLSTFLMAPGVCDWLTGQSIFMDGGNAIATGGNFYELRQWSDSDWQVARERIEAQNAKDKLQR